MNRAAPAVVVTLLGLVALATFKTSPGLPSKAGAALHAKTPVPPATAPPRPTTSTAPPPTRGSTTETNPATSPPTSTAPATNAGAVRTVDGDPYDNRYGTVQVQITLQGRQITNVTPLQMPTDRQRSAEISQQAAPLLLQEALQAQSAQIDIIGGASYTSQSYAQSLQSALDKAGA